MTFESNQRAAASFPAQIFQHYFLFFQNESSYVLQDSVTTENLISFVSDFKINKLARHLRGNANISHSYYFDHYRQYEVNIRKSDTRQNEKSTYGSMRAPKSITLTELNSNNFEKQVLDTNKVRHF